MIQLTLQAAAFLTGGTLHATHDPTATFCGFSIDTRTLTKEQLFIALPGQHTDGHAFLEVAQQKGAALAMVTHPVKTVLPQLIVADVVKAMGQLSHAWRKRFTIPFTAITGSNGKTTTKNCLANICIAACGDKAPHVLATEKSFNNHLGVPLTLARLNTTHRYAVLEMGMDHFGEIETLTHLAQPAVAIITNAANAHLEGVGGTIEGVARAKSEIFSGLTASGVAILNRDDTFFEYWIKKIDAHAHLSFGYHQNADIHVLTHRLIDHTQQLTLQTPQGLLEIQLTLLGQHNVYNAMAATAAALALKIPLDAIQQGLQKTGSVPGRLHQHTLSNQVTLIDDTYNANPHSLQAAIQTLASFPNQKILIIGDMHGLGTQTQDWHRHIGQLAHTHHIDYLLTYGEWSQSASQQFGERAYHFTDQHTLIEAVRPLLKPHTTLLIKGSHVMQMEKIVAALMEGENC